MKPTKCTYPDCNCPFDAPADPRWCARGLPKVKPGCLGCETAICDECDSENSHRNNVVVMFGKPAEKGTGEGPHLNASCRCLRCKHEWQGVMPVGTAVLECPACGCFAGCIAGLVEPEGERWACSCENQLFFLDRKGPPMCASCGLRAQSWVDA